MCTNKEAIENAAASVEMEGFKITEQDKQWGEKLLNKENAKFNDKYSFEFVEITGKDFKKFRDEHDVNVICAFRKIGWKY